MKHVPQVSGLRIVDYSSAQLVVDRSSQIRNSPSAIWSIICDHARGHEWLPSVKSIASVDVSNARVDRVGESRIAVYGSGDRIEETVVYTERDKVLAYRVAFPSMVTDHLVVIEITEEARQLCTVRMYAFFTPIQLSGLLMKYGVYALIVRSSLKKLAVICES